MDKTTIKTRFFANQCLILAFILYIVSVVCVDIHTSFLYLKAFSEAAMIGGIADWFAVTALFRYPLGLKIPHTAIIPNSKNKIAKNISHFIRENFLSESYVRENLKKIDFHEKTIILLEENKWTIKKRINKIIIDFIINLKFSSIQPFIMPVIKDKINEIDLTKFIANTMVYIYDKRYHQATFDFLLYRARDWLAVEENEKMINEQIKELIKKNEDGKNTITGVIKSFFVGEPKLHKYLCDFINHIDNDPTNTTRMRIDVLFADILDLVQSEGAIKSQILSLKEETLEKINIEKRVEELFEEFKKWLLKDLSSEDSFIKNKTNSMVDTFIQELHDNRALKLWIKRQTEHKIPILIANNAELIDSYFSDYIDNLDTEEMTKLIEDKVGDDLQFIRINGTIIGGFIGLIIYSVTELVKYLI